MSDATAAVEAAQPAVAADAAVAAVEETTKVVETASEEKEDKKEETKDEKKEETAAKDKSANNRKFDPSVLPESEDHAAIQTQVHFYFGDSNLPTDKYLWELTGGSENRPVEVKKICQFGRMRRFKSYETVVAALRESKFVVVSGEAGQELVARKNAYNPDRPRSKIDAATVYAKGFGDEEPSTQFDLEAFFTKHGAVNAVRLRRTADNLFKGSVFVEFRDADQAAKFLALDPKPTWKGSELKIMSKAAYVAEKSQLIREGKIEPSNNSAPRFYEGRILGGGRRGRGGGGHSADKDDWKKRRDDDRKNGFRDGRRGGRGGRSGGAGRGRGGRGNWNNKDNRNGHNGQNKPEIESTAGKSEGVASNKRGRDEDASNGASEPPAKKLDAKVEVTANAA